VGRELKRSRRKMNRNGRKMKDMKRDLKIGGK
jgi:hypothetical protein